MPEIRTVVVDREIEYEGLFNLKDLYKLIDRWFKEHAYEKQELKNEEDVAEDEKQVILRIKPYKKVSDYAMIEIKIEAAFSNLKSVEIEKDNIKIKMNKGHIKMVFNAYLVTDYEGKWENKPSYYFLRTIFDKFVFKGYTHKYEKEAVADCTEVQDEIKSFLNLNRF
jgi:hypothetical protein